MRLFSLLGRDQHFPPPSLCPLWLITRATIVTTRIDVDFTTYQALAKLVTCTSLPNPRNNLAKSVLLLLFPLNHRRNRGLEGLQCLSWC